MSRNASGTYTLPEADAVTGTTIEASWANNNLGDIETELTDSLSRSGKGNMSVPHKAVAGTVNAPGYAFVDEASTGLYRSGAADIRFAQSGSDVWRVASAAFQVYTSAAWRTPLYATGAQTITDVITFSSDPLIPDEAYGASWNGSLEPPTKNAVYDKIQTLATAATGDDTAYGVSWNGSTTAPSQNAVYDKIEAMSASLQGDDTVYGAGWNGSLLAPTQNAVYDKIEALVVGSGLISDTAYAGSWNGVTTIAPSKNAVYDEIELRATKASPTFTGTPAAPTAAVGTTTTQIATTAFVRTPSVQTVASAATVTPTAADDMVDVTALAVGAAFANPTGSPLEGQKLIVRIKDNGTARALSWGSEYRAVGETLPATTTISKVLYLGFIRNDNDTKWDLVAKTEQA